MAGKNPSKRVEEALTIAIREISDLKSKYGTLESKYGTLESEHRMLYAKYQDVLDTIKDQNRRLALYENANSPPSANSLEYKRIKKIKRQRRNDGRDGPRSAKKPGGQPGHRGVSRKHAPTCKKIHDFPDGRIPPCPECGGAQTRCTPEKRDIIDIRIIREETRHIIHTAQCGDCGQRHRAPNDLPARGSYGKNAVAMMASICAANVSFESSKKAMYEITGARMAKSTVINCMARTCDALKKKASTIAASVKRSKCVGIDETVANLAGKTGWTWVIQSGRNILMLYSKSRGALVLDTHMDRYGGIVISDKYAVYRRFDPGGHQLCWSHELRALLYESEKEGAPLSARILYEQVSDLYGRAADAASGPRSPELADAFRAELGRILWRYRGTEGTPLEAPLKRLRTSMPHLFVFLEHAGVEPTNNASERALRHVVVHRKISGQIKGGQIWMERWSRFMTCILTWQKHGLSVAGEVAKLV